MHPLCHKAVFEQRHSGNECCFISSLVAYTYDKRTGVCRPFAPSKIRLVSYTQLPIDWIFRFYWLDCCQNFRHSTNQGHRSGRA